MFVPLLKPLEITGHIIIALVAGAWLHVETAEFEALTESRMNRYRFLMNPPEPYQKISPNHMDAFMASMRAFEEKLNKEMHDIAVSITPEEAEIMLEMLKEDDSINA